MSKIEKRYMDKLHAWINQLEDGDKHPAFPSEAEAVELAFYWIEKELGYENPKVLDLGSGTGNILLMAKHYLGEDGNYYGIEHNSTYAAISKFIDPTFKIFTIDIFSKISKDLMSKADIIYTYIPFGGKELFKLYKTIAHKAKPGTLLVINDTNLKEDLFPKSVKVEPLKRIQGSDCCNKTDIWIVRKL